ncbi:MAG: hypothetical protein U0354_20340 [Candidatus Sericytochromatia bacterium]
MVDRKNLINLVKNEILKNNDINESKANEVSIKLFNHFINIGPEKKLSPLNSSEKTVILKQDIISGGKSRKISNITIHLGKLATDLTSNTLNLIGSKDCPWMFAIYILLFLSNIISLSEVEIKKEQAIVLWSLWTNIGKNNPVEENKILDVVNNSISTYGQHQMSLEVLKSTLNELEELKCIDKNNNKWLLIEAIRIEA